MNKMQSSISQSPVEKAACPQASLLVVEDEPMLLKLLEDILEEENYHTVFANSADDALSYLHSGEKFDLLVTDFKMPGSMNGVELSAEACAILKDLKVIITSGFNLSTMQLENNDCQYVLVQKPYTPFQLKEKIAQTLST
jgi:two-component system, cell cycle response regulator CpdR